MVGFSFLMNNYPILSMHPKTLTWETVKADIAQLEVTTESGEALYPYISLEQIWQTLDKKKKSNNSLFYTIDLDHLYYFYSIFATSPSYFQSPLK